ncbi:hypothetical protein [Cecembia rubra]|uniref:Uncharacterized protein n=1 Tax=Cecembia rubra TaxID=1485585 RepID=A0A2P8EA10_9BACT|nr:hypothetical protein [Cecembia rubra]PSL06299.1 hypothetical protein CLV48_102114 [Cecembia rubra]
MPDDGKNRALLRAICENSWTRKMVHAHLLRARITWISTKRFLLVKQSKKEISGGDLYELKLAPDVTFGDGHIKTKSLIRVNFFYNFGDNNMADDGKSTALPRVIDVIRGQKNK